MRIQFALLSVAFSAFSAVAMASPAQANCYETFGCTDSEYFAAHQLEQASCQVLWEVRISSSRSAAIASAPQRRSRPSAMPAAFITTLRACPATISSGPISARSKRSRAVRVVNCGRADPAPRKKHSFGARIGPQRTRFGSCHGRACLLAFLSLLPVSPRL